MSAEMTRANWRQMVSEAQRANDSRIREVLGQSLRQARDLGGRFTEQAGRVAGERLTAAKENIRAGELQKQGIRSASSGGAAFLVGLARGYVGDQAAKVAGVPMEFAAGFATHLVAAFGLAGTPAGAVAHGVADGLLAASAVQLGRAAGMQMRARATAQSTAAGYEPGYGYALPGYASAGASTAVADRAMAEAIDILAASAPINR